jgi:hypothetical protein
LHYRLYELKPTGSIARGSDLEASNDEEAIAQARALHEAKGKSFELWCGTRRVLEQEGGPR